MRRLLAIITLILTTLSVSAQERDRIDFFNQGSKSRHLQEENRIYKARIDSLNHVLDSMKRSKRMGDSLMMEYSPVVDVTPVRRSPEVTDSLVNIWLEKRRIRDYIDITEYNMDSIRFTSDVPDSVMVKRLKGMNPFFTLPYNETVRNYMVLYSEKMKSKMGRVLGLSQYYMPIFEETFAKYDLPLEIKYLAIIESSLNPVARSRAGAMGMWQFMYRTARGYGLKINSFVDERLDVEKAVDAAARYLEDAYKVFGDWSLAISSYNCGAGNVNKAIKRAGSNDFWAIYDYLPRETRGYMPAFVGAMYAMTYYKEYGIVPEEMGMPAATDTFEIRKNLHFMQINEVVGVPMETIRDLNPQYIHEIIPGQEETWILRLPTNWSNAFLSANQDSLYNHKASKLISPQVLQNIRNGGYGDGERIAYKVKSGDYLGRIASRYHVSVDQLMKWNHLKSSSLRVGQILYIYPKGTGTSQAAIKAAEEQAAAAAKAAEEAAQSKDKESEAAEAAETEIVESPADTVVFETVEFESDVFAEEDVPAELSEESLAEEIAEGSSEEVAEESVEISAEEAVELVAQDDAAVPADTVKQQGGADLSSLLRQADQARKAEEDEAARKAAAEAAEAKRIAEQKAKAEAEAKAAAAAKADPAPGYVVYTVKKGDTLFGIAKQFPGVSAQNIIDYNKLKSNAIQIGMKLRIPTR